MSDYYLIVGLGNPGREYRYNRHNAGFMLLDRVVERHKIKPFTRRQAKALISTGRLGGASLVLAKPQTYMNLSGEAVGALMRFYDVALERLLVCFDDIDLPIGTLRLRPEGGSAGHNGMKSIIERLGTQAFPRLRLGVGRPLGAKAAAAHVLKDFRSDEAELMAITLEMAVDAIEAFVTHGIAAAMSRFNGPPRGNERLPGRLSANASREEGR